MGFNAMRPGKVRKGDLVFLGAAAVAIAALLLWAFWG